MVEYFVRFLDQVT